MKTDVETCLDWNQVSRKYQCTAIAVNLQDFRGKNGWSSSGGHGAPLDKCRLLYFEVKDIPGIDDIALEMDLSGRVTANHDDPIQVLKAVVRWLTDDSKEGRVSNLPGEVLVRLLISHLIVQKEF